MSGTRSRGVEEAFEIGVHELVPVLIGNICRCERSGVDTGAVENMIDPALSLDDIADKCVVVL